MPERIVATVRFVNIFEVIADRRIEQARDEGILDNLAGAGRPIDDLDQVRQPGWWAARLVRRERDLAKDEDEQMGRTFQFPA